jgi:hypothetical protein
MFVTSTLCLLARREATPPGFDAFPQVWNVTRGGYFRRLVSMLGASSRRVRRSSRKSA